MEKKEMMNEAVRRMKAVDLMDWTIKALVEKGEPCLSEGGGFLYNLNSDEKAMVDEFEEQYGCLCWHVVKSVTNIGTIYSLLYVSDAEEEWESDFEDLKDGYPLIYAVNDDIGVKEFGGARIVPSIGGMKRVFG